MTLFRTVPFPVHGALESLAAPVLVAAPFVVGCGSTAGAASIALGVMLMGLALSTHGEPRIVPLSAHVGFDYLIAALALVAALAAGVAGAPAIATVFLAGFGTAHLALTASTRFSVRGA